MYFNFPEAKKPYTLQVAAATGDKLNQAVASTKEYIHNATEPEPDEKSAGEHVKEAAVKVCCSVQVFIQNLQKLL